MIHNKCKHQLELDVTGLYSFRSKSITTSTKGIFPGMVEISAIDKKQTPKLFCSYCSETFSGKDEFEAEIIEECSVCKESFPPSEIVVTDYIPRICNNCVKDNASKLDTNNISARYLSLYREVIKDGNNPTLLTILLKKQ